jgi:hypothetical protein
MDVDPDNLTYIDSISAERLFLDIKKYASRNRGLTREDQRTPVKITDIDNRWLFEPDSAGNRSGIIDNTVNNQKLVPYQTNYEINKKNEIGLCYQSDDFQFWSTDFFAQWTKPAQYPLNFRKEIIFASYFNRIDSLLTDKGIMTDWRTDIFGNNYGLIKEYDDPTERQIQTEREVDTISEFSVPLFIE